MDQQKVFPTACFGFDKKVVLDYIYEQDTAAKAREAEMEQHTTELEEQIAELQSSVEELSAQCELIKAQLYNEKETAAGIRASYEKLKSDTDQLVQVARNKDKELQIQLELNRQLQHRNGELEKRLSDLTRELTDTQSGAQELMEEARTQAALILERARREARAIRDTVAKDAASRETDNSAEVARLREEFGRVRETVGKTLTKFEGVISRLDGEKEKAEEKQAAPAAPAVPSAETPAPAASERKEQDPHFFPKKSGPKEPGRVKAKKVRPNHRTEERGKA